MNESTTSSANGNSSPRQYSRSTGRTQSTGETSPNLSLIRGEGRGEAIGDRKTGHLSLVVSPANPSATRDEDEARKTTATSGRTCLRLYETSNQHGSSLKTCVALLLGTTAWYSKPCALIWNAKVTKSNRLLFQLSPSVRRTAGTGSGLSLTVTASEPGQDTGTFKKRMRKYPNGMAMANLATQVRLLATPNTLDSMEPKTEKALIKEITQTRPGRSKLSNLRDQIAYGPEMPALIPTPTASDWKGRGLNSKQAGIDKLANHETIPTGTGTGRRLRLQPAMTEWMMGFPESWTEFPIVGQGGAWAA